MKIRQFLDVEEVKQKSTEAPENSVIDERTGYFEQCQKGHDKHVLHQAESTVKVTKM